MVRSWRAVRTNEVLCGRSPVCLWTLPLGRAQHARVAQPTPVSQGLGPPSDRCSRVDPPESIPYTAWVQPRARLPHFLQQFPRPNIRSTYYVFSDAITCMDAV